MNLKRTLDYTLSVTKNLAGVMRKLPPDAAEIHFFKEIEFFDQYLKCEIVNKIGPPNKGFYKNNLSPTDIYYAGVKYIEQLTDKSPETIRKSIYK